MHHDPKGIAKCVITILRLETFKPSTSSPVFTYGPLRDYSSNITEKIMLSPSDKAEFAIV